MVISIEMSLIPSFRCSLYSATLLSQASAASAREAFDDVAVVTFHIRDEDLSRRTLVSHRAERGWQIEHLHGSNAPLPDNRTGA